MSGTKYILSMIPTCTLTMQNELHRIASYYNWPGDEELSPMLLARMGFYYVASTGTVTCFHCEIPLDRCRREENLLQKHRQRSPHCEVANGNCRDNVPLGGALPPIRSKTTTDPPGETAPENESDGSAKYRPTASNDHQSASNIDDTKFEENSNLWKIYVDASARLNRCREQNLADSSSSVICEISDRKLPTSSDFDKLRVEEVRLRTFHDWPSGANASPEPLARGGFFYTGGNDRVQCAFCRGFLRNWEPNDVPSAEHRKHFPDCPFLRGMEVGNRPLAETMGFVVDTATKVPNGKVCGNSRETGQTVNLLSLREAAASNNFFARSAATSESNSSTGGVTAKHPEYADYHQRIQSFGSGKVAVGQTAEGLSDAGWFYSGPGDKVLCFQCGGSLKEWRPSDDPWEEHKRWYPKCSYWQTNIPRPDLQRLTIPAVTGRLSVDPREVKARMDTPTVRAILDMGFSRDVIKRAIENRLSTTGDDFVNAEGLMEAIFQLEETMTSSLSATSAPAAIQSIGLPKLNFSPGAAANVYTASNLSFSMKPTVNLYAPEYPAMSSTEVAMPLASLPIGRHAFAIGSALIPTFAATSSSQSLASELSVSAAAASAMTTNAEGSTEASKTKGKRRRNKKKKVATAVAGNDDAATSSAPENSPDANPSCLTETPADPSELLEEHEEFQDIPDDEAMKYLEENRQLREARTCKVCMDAEVNTVFLPCGHLVCCNECSPQLRNCPICRTFIRGTVKTFLS